MAGTRQRTPPKPRAGATAVTTTHPGHAIRGGLSLIAWPAIVFLLLVPLGGPLAYRAADAYGMRVLGLVLAGCFGYLAFAVHEHANARMKWLRRQGSWSIAWAAAFLGWVVAFGPDKWWFGLELTTGLVLTVWWSFAKTEPWRGNGTDAHGGEDGAWQRAVGLADTTRPVKVKDEHGERHVEVEHTDNTTDEIVKAKDKIEAKGKLPKGSVRVEPVMQAGRVLAHMSRYVISRESFLERVPDWSGPDRPGALISDPVRVGWCADRKPSEWILPPTEDTVGSPAALSSGMSGAAKTAFQLNLLGNLSARRGVVVWGSDTRKAGQWAPFVRPLLDWFAVTPEEAKVQLRALAAIVPVRTELIAELTGEDRWTPICWTKHGIPLLLHWMAESAPLMGMLEEEMERGVEVWRSAGEKVISEHQRPSEDNVSTNFRNLVPESFAFRCAKYEDGRMALNEETLEAGAEPWTFPEDMPGLHYAEMVNEPRSRRGMKRRTEKPNRLLVAVTVAEWMTTHPEWHRLDERTAAAADDATGGAYSSREQVPVTDWIGSRWGKPPQLRDPSVMTWVEKAKTAAPTAPSRPAPAPSPQEEHMEPEESPDLAMTEYEHDTDTHEDQEIAMEADRVLEQVDAEVNYEEGPDPEDTPLGPLTTALTFLEQPHDGDDDPDLDWTSTPKHPRPSAQQRAVNFQTMVRRLFTEPTLGGKLEEQIDGRWIVAGTEDIVTVWLSFPGEDVRPALYPRLRAHAKARNAKQLARGRWAISERALAEPLVIPDDYDPDPPLDPDAEPDEAENAATERDLTDVLQ